MQTWAGEQTIPWHLPHPEGTAELVGGYGRKCQSEDPPRGLHDNLLPHPAPPDGKSLLTGRRTTCLAISLCKGAVLGPNPSHPPHPPCTSRERLLKEWLFAGMYPLNHAWCLWSINVCPVRIQWTVLFPFLARLVVYLTIKKGEGVCHCLQIKEFPFNHLYNSLSLI